MHDIAQPLATLAEQIRKAHKLVIEGISVALAHAKEAGTLLIEAKQQLKHGEWLPWLKEQVGISARTAQGYMRVAMRWPEIEANTQRVSHLPLREGLKLLAAPRRIPWDDETDTLARVAKFNAWFDAMFADWNSDKALMDQIMANPDASPRQLAFVMDIAKQYKSWLAETEVRAAIEFAWACNEVETQHGKRMLRAVLANPTAVNEAIEKRLADLSAADQGGTP